MELENNNNNNNDSRKIYPEQGPNIHTETHTYTYTRLYIVGNKVR